MKGKETHVNWVKQNRPKYNYELSWFPIPQREKME